MKNFSQTLMSELADVPGVAGCPGLELGPHVLAVVAGGRYPRVYVYFDARLWQCSDTHKDCLALSSFCMKNGIELVTIRAELLVTHDMIVAAAKAALLPVEGSCVSWHAFPVSIRERSTSWATG